MFFIVFIINNVLLGVGLAMDAFSVSIANGLRDAKMPMRRMCTIAGTFGIFHAVMPMVGWLVVHEAVKYMQALSPFIPWVALCLLLYIGGGMIISTLKPGDKDKDEACRPLGFASLMTQGVATSIDVLSVGFSTAHLGFGMALLSAAIISLVTFAFCIIGLAGARRVGPLLAGKAELWGGIILIVIGIEIWVTGVFFA